MYGDLRLYCTRSSFRFSFVRSVVCTSQSGNIGDVTTMALKGSRGERKGNKSVNPWQQRQIIWELGKKLLEPFHSYVKKVSKHRQLSTLNWSPKLWQLVKLACSYMTSFAEDNQMLAEILHKTILICLSQNAQISISQSSLSLKGGTHPLVYNHE